MDLARMLQKCQRDQWTLQDVEWATPPRPMSREQEQAVVQYFTDMAAIERLAKTLFEEQGKRVSDPTLKRIYSTFVADEERHAQVAERLARHYDVHRYRAYRTSPAFDAFRPAFIAALRYLSDEVANGYVTGGELLLDVALLRSINDYVDDAASSSAMNLINRDESRHIAVDYHMVEYYSSEAYQRERRSRPRPPLGHYVRAAWAFLRLLRTGGPFFMQLFYEPMRVADPSGRRLREAVKRMQLLQNMPGVEHNPLARFGLLLRDTYNHPVFGRYFGGLVQRIVGIPDEFIRTLYDEREAGEARRKGFDWLAQQALGAKYAP